MTKQRSALAELLLTVVVYLDPDGSLLMLILVAWLYER